MTMATNTRIITEVFPMSERGRALGMIGACFVRLHRRSWIGRSDFGAFFLAVYFWINVPVGILTMIAGEKVLPKDITMSHDSIDKPGLCCFQLQLSASSAAFFLDKSVAF